MFNNCTKLKSGFFPLLTNIYIGMNGENIFDSCRSLKTMVTSNVNIVKDPYSFANIFYNCNAIDFTCYNTSSEPTSLINNAPAGSTFTLYPYAYTRQSTISVSSTISKTYGDAPFNLGASSNSDAPFSYVSSNTNVATIDLSGVVTIVGAGTATINITQAENDNHTSASATTIIEVLQLPIGNICFIGNTPVKVDQGTFAISKLKEGIHSIDGKPIKRITKIKTNDKHLICIEKHALDMNVPSQKTIITANHKIMYKGKMVKSKDLIGLVDNVYKIEYCGDTLYNVLLETQETMSVNNIICETLNPENVIVKLYDILDNMPSEYHQDIIVEFNNQIKDKNLLKYY
jgi:hypothetical protein